MLLLLLDSCIWFFSRELLLHMETEENPVSCSLNGNEVDEEYSLSLNLQTNNDVIDGGGEKEEGGMIMIPPTIGMAFQSFDEARDFYKQYAVQKGFETKIKSSWSRKKTKEKYSALLTCSCEGFKETKEDALYRRQDIRVGCKAHMRVKLLKSNKWEVISVHLDHNHECSPSLSRRCRSHRLVESGSKRIRKLTSCSNPIKKRTVNMKRFELNSDAGMQLNKPFIVGAVEPPNLSFEEKDVRNHVDNHKQSILGEGDAEVLHNYFTHMQQKNSNFFYLMDLDKEGHLKNVFWAHARSRTAYGYFGDVVTFDTTYLTNRYDLRFASFVGVNHHGQSVLLGCCLLGDQSTETFIWVFQAWLTCMSGCPPNAIITEQCIAIQIAISKVFPRTRHRLCLWHIMKKIPEKLGKLSECKAIKQMMKNIVYDSLRVDEFEAGWTNMIEQYGLVDIEWLRTLCKLRQLWVPVYVKDIFFAGMSTTRRKESPCSFFDGYVDAKTSLKEFIERYDSALSEKYEKEAQADFESVYIDPFLKTSCCFEGQIAKLYTRGMFLKFQDEVYSMASCSKSRLRVDGSFITYLVKERIIDKAGKRLEPKVYEVLYNVSKVKVRCICRLFEYRGILCKHSLCVLNEFVDEIPSQYILSRWTKDFQRKYVLDHVSNNTDVRTPVQRHVALYQNAIQIVDEGVISDSSYKVVLQELQELKKKVQRLNNVSSDIENNACEGTETNVMQTTTQPNTIGCTEVLDPLQASRVEQTTENRFQSCLAQSSFQTTANFEDHHVMHGRSYITGCFDPTSAFRVHNQVHTASTTLTTRDFGIHGTAQAEGTE